MVFLRGGEYAILSKTYHKFVYIKWGLILKKAYLFYFFRHWSQRVHNLNTLDFGVSWCKERFSIV